MPRSPAAACRKRVAPAASTSGAALGWSMSGSAGSSARPSSRTLSTRTGARSRRSLRRAPASKTRCVSSTIASRSPWSSRCVVPEGPGAPEGDGLVPVGVPPAADPGAPGFLASSASSSGPGPGRRRTPRERSAAIMAALQRRPSASKSAVTALPKPDRASAAQQARENRRLAGSAEPSCPTRSAKSGVSPEAGPGPFSTGAGPNSSPARTSSVRYGTRPAKTVCRQVPRASPQWPAAGSHGRRCSRR